ncbi:MULTISPECIES: hypothetical protein [Tsukamurella]|uniref:DUF2530 domain-containing protein n=1 Tax=Tsukamurella asaccharolytica TaxID=2592067 RepID=A0A5C5R393_9ACTN|nr:MULTISPECIES: hypothetical protein [Tsukamurella]KXP04257.1 hypothetical protein AXK59_12445 [Tsukamurella tyrosinosolvens]TWS17757.1 hypothetical protein FK529_18865 [Tsukamurella asaccharolytica]
MNSGGNDPGSWVDRLVGWCFGLLLAAVAINCAVALIQQVLPTLVVVLGIVGVVAVVILAVRWWRDRW